MSRRLRTAGRLLWRFHRLLIPIGTAVVLVVAAVAVHLLAQPSVTDGDYLNPASTTGIGGATLATGLTGANVTIRRTSDIDEALDWARGGSTTLFVPAPGLLNEYSDAALTTMPTSTRIVLVDPPAKTISYSGAPISEVGDSWAEFPAAAGCAAPETAAAPWAGTGRHFYAGGTITTSCYDGSVVRLPDTDLWLVGSADPFRNDRISEHDNRALVTALLSAHGSVIWLDNHHKQPRPKAGPNVANPFNPDHQQDPAAPPPTSNSIAELFPGWMWTVLGLLLLVLLVIAIAASRRFGPPVTEPMPVTAKARETVEGRGRLYRRAKQPTVALAALRAEAIRQLPGLLGADPGLPATALFDLVAERAEVGRDDVEAILITDTPATNEELAIAVARLDALLTRLTDSLVSAHGMDRT